MQGPAGTACWNGLLVGLASLARLGCATCCISLRSPSAPQSRARTTEMPPRVIDAAREGGEQPVALGYVTREPKPRQLQVLDPDVGVTK